MTFDNCGRLLTGRYLQNASSSSVTLFKKKSNDCMLQLCKHVGLLYNRVRDVRYDRREALYARIEDFSWQGIKFAYLISSANDVHNIMISRFGKLIQGVGKKRRLLKLMPQ